MKKAVEYLFYTLWFLILLFILFITEKQKNQIELLRKSVLFISQVEFYEAGEQEPTWDENSKKFIIGDDIKK